MAKKPYNPVEKTADYKKMTADRGYGYFSDKAVAIQREKNENSGVNVNKLRDAAKKHADEYMRAVNDTGHPDHLESRKEYYNKYGGNRKNIEDAKFHQLCNMTNYAQLPMRNTSYERNILEQPERNPTADQAREHKVFSDLMRAKFDAVGYEGDDEVINEFKREYGSVAISSDADQGARQMSNIMNRLKKQHFGTGE